MLLCTFYTSSPDYVKHLLFYTSFTVHDVNVLGVPCPGCGIPHPPGSIGIVPSRRFAVVRFFVARRMKLLASHVCMRSCCDIVVEVLSVRPFVTL